MHTSIEINRKTQRERQTCMKRQIGEKQKKKDREKVDIEMQQTNLDFRTRNPENTPQKQGR
jgi:hypothetical protein